MVDGGQVPNFASASDEGRRTCHSEGTLHWLRALARPYEPAELLR